MLVRSRWAIFAFLLCLPITPQAQESDKETPPEVNIEIDLEALEALSPGRETGQPFDVLAPPSVDTGALKQPPELTYPVRPADAGPQPQSPAAPRMTDQGPVSNSGDMSGVLMVKDITILFEKGSIDLSLEAAETLDRIGRLANRGAARVQLFGYAGNEKSSPSTTRRLALRRTVAIRGYLMDQGVDGTRIDLRPQGPNKEEGPRETVVIKFLKK